MSRNMLNFLHPSPQTRFENNCSFEIILYDSFVHTCMFVSMFFDKPIWSLILKIILLVAAGTLR